MKGVVMPSKSLTPTAKEREEARREFERERKKMEEARRQRNKFRILRFATRSA